MVRTACTEPLCLYKGTLYVISSAKGSHSNYSAKTPKEKLSHSDVIRYGLQNGHVAVVPDCRMVTWLWYGRKNGHVAVVLDRRMVTWLC